MSQWFYPKLAAGSLVKNRKVYLPFWYTCIASIAMFYMMTTLWQNKSLGEVKAGQILQLVLAFGAVVMGIFSVIFLFYTNSFLVKRRKKEMGLFNILGMEKRHLAVMIFYETLYIGSSGIVVGLLLGTVFNRMVFQIVWHILQFDSQIQYQQSMIAVQYTILLFVGIFIAIFLDQLRQIHLANPIQLLQGGTRGEQEPKSKWLIAFLGIVFLGSGYVIANWHTDPIEIILYFFVGVVFVIIGTYCLFTAGSIVFLKQMRKNKKYYYQTKHFISVSTMLYRMKQNAVGLANICVLATMLLVVIASTTSLFFGINDILDRIYPKSIMIGVDASKNVQVENIRLQVERTLQKFGVTAIDPISITYLEFMGQRDPEGFEIHSIQQFGSKDTSLFVLTEREYNQFANEKLKLDNDGVAIFSDMPFGERFRLSEKDYQVNQTLSGKATGSEVARILYQFNTTYLIVKDEVALQELIETETSIIGKEGFEYEFDYKFDVDKEKEREIYQELLAHFDDEVYIGYREEMANQVSAMYGGLFFVGIFLGCMFLMATVLIIYYKQVSEGYDDRQRYIIMKKVGLDVTEINNTIRSQICTVFFFPLVVAGIHVAFAYPALVKLLNIMGFGGNNILFFYCTIGCFIVFGILYTGTYALTAKIYNQIVNWEE